MSTPRPWTCTCAGRDKKVWHADPTCEVHGEGVAAPLEPTHRANDFFKANYAKFPLGFQQQPVVFEFAEAYAAAVSKNLQEERTRETEWWVAKWNKAMNEKERAESRISDLEKEIAALRETKP